MIRLESVTKRFGGITAADDVTTEFTAGQVTAVIGPNGSGKTTLFNLIGGYLKPDRGVVRFESDLITGLPPYRIARKGLARTFQTLRLAGDLTAIENVMLAEPRQPRETLPAALLRRQRVSAQHEAEDRALSYLEVFDIANRAWIRTGAMSYGEQKLLGLACCFAARPRCFFLDEPVAGINPMLVDRILPILRRLAADGCAVVLIEHDLEAVRQVADRLMIMDAGRVVASGEPGALMENPALLEAYLR